MATSRKSSKNIDTNSLESSRNFLPAVCWQLAIRCVMSEPRSQLQQNTSGRHQPMSSQRRSNGCRKRCARWKNTARWSTSGSHRNSSNYGINSTRPRRPCYELTPPENNLKKFDCICWSPLQNAKMDSKLLSKRLSMRVCGSSSRAKNH